MSFLTRKKTFYSSWNLELGQDDFGFKKSGQEWNLTLEQLHPTEFHVLNHGNLGPEGILPWFYTYVVFECQWDHTQAHSSEGQPWA